jgi:hypothetical protein
MRPDFLRRSLENEMRLRGHDLDGARREVADGMGLSGDQLAVLDAVIEEIRRENQKILILDVPRGVHSNQYELVEGDAKENQWYSGPREEDTHWPRLRANLELGSLRDVVDDIDRASTKVVAHFANPGVAGLKKKGLVLGYVQSGKTANYTAVIAKAADAGYKMVIVLSGMHNNLRRQTQARINTDLGEHNWVHLTNEEADFGSVSNGSASLRAGARTIAVVKKNSSRLQRLREWLKNLDPLVLRLTPILILDDEADQATPNSKAASDEISKINALVREIWREVRTGTYVGYTATPFANVFMDPDDDDDLFPSDFIIDLPKAEAYFGAERIFGRSSVDEDDQPVDGLDVVREVTGEEAEGLRPPSKAAQRSDFDPELPASLERAVRWFALSVAVRRIRGQGDRHSSMLIHTSQYVDPHFAMKERITDLLAEWHTDPAAQEQAFADVYDDEIGQVAVGGHSTPDTEAVVALMPDVLEDLRVVVDNGRSTDRLVYGRRDGDGKPLVENVIAIGGGTLSRGLTLEGLVVSYFVRTSNTYDTLLQMGRWFGYRVGYEDLPRIWMTKDLADDFSFLALVEEEIRSEMANMEDLKVSPRQFGLKVRAHPGRLAITAANKMVHADVVSLSYGGQRHQTIVLHERQPEVLRRNLEATRSLVVQCIAEAGPPTSVGAHAQFFGMTSAVIVRFLSEFTFHERQPGLNGDHMISWINSAVPRSPWNVVVVGSSKELRRDGEVVPLGTEDLGLHAPVPLVNRAPLEVERTFANIKALLSQQDWAADFSPEETARRANGQSWESLRRETKPDEGLLIIYPVSRHSVPARATQNARRSMDSEETLIGLGIVFPPGPGGDDARDATYVSVKPDWEPLVDEDAEFEIEDTEGSLSVDAQAGAVLRD